MKYEIVMKHFCGLFARTPETSLIDKTAITVTNQGTGYTSVPVITIVGTASTIATATATLETVSTISSIVIDNPGSGYITDPTVSIDPPPGMGITATAKASIARGTNYGKVYLLTSLGQTQTGARAIAQMEVASPVVGWNSTGALTLEAICEVWNRKACARRWLG